MNKHLSVLIFMQVIKWQKIGLETFTIFIHIIKGGVHIDRVLQDNFEEATKYLEQ